MKRGKLTIEVHELDLIEKVAMRIMPNSWDDRPHLEVKDGEPVIKDGKFVINETMTAYALKSNADARNVARDIAMDILAIVREHEASHNRREGGAAPA